MNHIPPLIHDLTLILGVAGIVTIVCKWLKQPVVLGYIVAGCLVGPHFNFFPSITEISSIQIWAEIGVIFLLFGLGLEFSFKRLAKVGGAASITALVEILSMLGLGYLAGRYLGWSPMDSLFLGGILSISSTTIIIRALDELGLKSRKFVSLVFGALIVEDLVAILLLVLLSTLAVSQQFAGRELLGKTAQLGFFLILWFLGGIFVLPTLLKKGKRFLNDETLLVISLALCLFMVFLANKAGFSPALGAFIMGSLLAETTEAEKIEHLTRPVKDFFAAIFFVSVGMLINPTTLFEHGHAVLFITLLTICGKTLSTTLGALISGQPLRHSVQTGMSLAQIGEFSFIIASLGLTLKVTSDFLYPVAVAVSALTTLTTPYLIRSADRTASWIEKTLPKNWVIALHQYSRMMQNTSQNKGWRQTLQIRLLRILGNTILTIGILWLSANNLKPFLFAQWGKGEGTTLIYAGITLLVASPFLWAMAFGGTQANSLRAAYKAATRLGPLLFVEILRFLATTTLILTFILRLEISQTTQLILMGILFGALSLSWPLLARIYLWCESIFLHNLSERERAASALDPNQHELAPWDAHMASFKIPPEAAFVGKTFLEMGLRERFGVTVALIQRGHKRITAPGREECLYPHDSVGVIGTDEQLHRFKVFLDTVPEKSITPHAGDYVLRSFNVHAESPFVNKAIRESGLRERTNGLVVGIERGTKRILNPDSTTLIEAGDLLWIVGEESRLKEI